VATVSTRFPEVQRTNLTQQLAWALQRRMDEEDLSFDKAFSQVALDILGYELDAGVLSDGKGDFGIDFWIVDERAATVFQFKSQDFTEKLDPALAADPSYLTDLPRIETLLTHLDQVPKEANAKVTDFVKELRSAVHRHSLTSHASDIPFEITVFFCCLARGFTDQAAEEFERISQDKSLLYANQRIRIGIIPTFIDDLIAERWRESNTDWRTSTGDRDDRIELPVRGEMISSPKSAVFFTNAYDLVAAFDRFGYQMFEPNVRCELKRSKVNEAIRESVKHSRGRKEFKHLNNGITLISAGFDKKRRGQEQMIRITQPGVINGLQTVKSIHDAFDELNDKEKAHFIADCEVLVRLHTRAAVADYKELVKSTNNQNPMQPRNLRSNDPEQVYFETLFADMNWFYERKEGAWKAFQSDSSLWGSLRGKKVSDFKSRNTAELRNIDNLEMAQAWLSFIGFSNEAIHFKRDIFSDEKFYDLIFKKRIVKHGYDYNLSFSDAGVRGEAEDQSPNPQVLLLAEILREVADKLTSSRKQNRDEAVKRLRLEKEKKEAQDAKLVQDGSYIRGLVLAGAKYLFVDFCGLVLFRALGPSLYDKAAKLLQTKSMKPMFLDRDIAPMETVLAEDDFETSDIFAVMWGLYNYCLENIIEQASWRQQFEQAAVRSRFNYSDYNRRALFGQLENLDRVYPKRALPQPWSEGIERHKGIYSYVREVCDNGRAKRSVVRRVRA
jgi:hypothetical protein